MAGRFRHCWGRKTTLSNHLKFRLMMSSTYLPFKSQYPHTNSPNCSLYISLKNELREFDKRSKHFLLGDHFINSHNLVSWQCMDIVRRKLKFVTIGTWRVNHVQQWTQWRRLDLSPIYGAIKTLSVYVIKNLLKWDLAFSREKCISFFILGKAT